MEIINSLDEILLQEESGISLGTFDGLHRGHNKILGTLIHECKLMNYKSVVYTFKNHPREVTTANTPKKIINNNKKIKLLRQIGIDYLVMVDFDHFHKNIDAKSFVDDILLNKLKMKNIVVGFDCRFGENAKGDTKLLKELSLKYNFDLNIIEPLKLDNEIVSSTLVRKFIQDGNIIKANEFLGRKYSIAGKVIKGKQLGKKLGFPTANIYVDFEICLPKNGIYITETLINGAKYKSVTNIGYNPTFEQKNYNIETHIFNFNEMLYDKNIEIEFHKRIRDEKYFENIEKLKEQVKSDIINAKIYFNTYY